MATIQNTSKMIAPPPLSFSRFRLFPPPEVCRKTSACPVGEQRDRAHHGRDDGHEPNIEIAHVAELVRDDALQFLARHGIEQPSRHRNGCVLWIAAGGKRVRIRIGDDIHLRLGQARRDAHLFDHISQLANLQHVVVGRASGQRTIDRTAPVDKSTARSPE